MVASSEAALCASDCSENPLPRVWQSNQEHPAKVIAAKKSHPSGWLLLSDFFLPVVVLRFLREEGRAFRLDIFFQVTERAEIDRYVDTCIIVPVVLL